MVAGCGVFVFVPPRILRNFGLFPVGTIPSVDACRRAEQRLQACLRRRIAADLELEEIKRLADLADLNLRGVRFGFFAAPDEVAADDAEHDADENQHDQYLN